MSPLPAFTSESARKNLHTCGIEVHYRNELLRKIVFRCGLSRAKKGQSVGQFLRSDFSSHLMHPMTEEVVF